MKHRWTLHVQRAWCHVTGASGLRGLGAWSRNNCTHMHGITSGMDSLRPQCGRLRWQISWRRGTCRDLRRTEKNIQGVWSRNGGLIIYPWNKLYVSGSTDFYTDKDGLSDNAAAAATVVWHHILSAGVWWNEGSLGSNESFVFPLLVRLLGLRIHHSDLGILRAVVVYDWCWFIFPQWWTTQSCLSIPTCRRATFSSRSSSTPPL